MNVITKIKILVFKKNLKYLSIIMCATIFIQLINRSFVFQNLKNQMIVDNPNYFLYLYYSLPEMIYFGMKFVIVIACLLTIRYLHIRNFVKRIAINTSCRFLLLKNLLVLLIAIVLANFIFRELISQPLLSKRKKLLGKTQFEIINIKKREKLANGILEYTTSKIYGTAFSFTLFLHQNQSNFLFAEKVFFDEDSIFLKGLSLKKKGIHIISDLAIKKGNTTTVYDAMITKTDNKNERERHSLKTIILTNKIALAQEDIRLISRAQFLNIFQLIRIKLNKKNENILSYIEPQKKIKRRILILLAEVFFISLFLFFDIYFIKTNYKRAIIVLIPLFVFWQIIIVEIFKIQV